MSEVESVKAKSHTGIYEPVEICLFGVHEVDCVFDCPSHQNPDVECVLAGWGVGEKKQKSYLSIRTNEPQQNCGLVFLPKFQVNKS